MKSWLLLALLCAPGALGARETKSPATPTPDAMQYVSENGNDANDGFSMGSAKLTIAAAYQALPSCTVARYGGSSTFDHCGQIVIGPGTFSAATPLVIDTPHVSIRGNLTGTTLLRYTGTTGCYFQWHDANFGGPSMVDFDGGLFDVTIDGSRAAPGTCGLETYDIVGFQMRGVAFDNFPGEGSSGWWDNAIKHFQERDRAQWECANTKICWNITGQPENPNGYPTTFGYGDFNFWTATGPGQVAASLSGAVLSASTIHAVINGGGRAGVGFTVSNHSIMYGDTAAVHFENLIAAGGFVIDETSAVLLIGTYDYSGIVNTIAPGGIFQFFHVGNNGSAADAGVHVDFQNPATFSANRSSPWLTMNGNYWNGRASAKDIWNMGVVLGAGTNPNSTFGIFHGPGSPGSSAFGVTGNLILWSTHANSAGVTLKNPPGIADSPQITFPDASGNVAVVGSQQLQAFNTTMTCVTDAQVGATCTTGAIALPVSYWDTNYRLDCTGLSPNNVPVVETVTKSNATFTITIAALTAAPATYRSYDCTATHN